MKNMEKIKIGEKEYNLKYTLRSLFIFEQIEKKPFKIETLLDNYVFFYSILLANNPNDCISWDEFIDAMDDDATLFQRMTEVIEKQQKKNDIFSEDDEKDSKQKKR